MRITHKPYTQSQLLTKNKPVTREVGSVNEWKVEKGCLSAAFLTLFFGKNYILRAIID